ncbi:MAG: ABC transporter ATP-binding protein [Gammaproteobacteria bacterium]|nr:ABC transporter ATP-binding protein [Gammaproteobacteria bacterium]
MISIKAFSKHFGSIRALDGIDLGIPAGAPTGLVGPNGAGKTTLFSVLCGFLRPTSGEVRIFDLPPLTPALHGRIAILPQDAALAHSVPVIKQLTFFAELQGFARREARVEADRVLGLVNLRDAANRAPEQLSHGMAKRAAIAQAFIGSPDLILLDEPTSGLDANTAGPIRELIRATGDQRKFVISSHNLADIEDLCVDVVILNQGKVTTHRPISELVARSAALTFNLEQAAPVNVIEKMLAVTGVTQAEVLGDDRRRLRVRFEAASEVAAQVQILNALQAAGITFKDMSRGESLEQKVREITR